MFPSLILKMIYLVLGLAGLSVWLIRVIVKWCSNDYTTVMVVGRKRSGKSLYLAWKANTSKMRHVYSNFGVGIPLKDDYWSYDYPPESLILIDEAGLVHDNRNFKTFPPEAVEFFKYQGKRHLQVILASHSMDIDKKIRDILDRIIVVEKFLIFVKYQAYQHKIITEKDPETGVERLADGEVKTGLPKLKLLPKLVKKSATFDTEREISK